MKIEAATISLYHCLLYYSAYTTAPINKRIRSDETRRKPLVTTAAVFLALKANVVLAEDACRQHGVGLSVTSLLRFLSASSSSSPSTAASSSSYFLSFAAGEFTTPVSPPATLASDLSHTSSSYSTSSSSVSCTSSSSYNSTVPYPSKSSSDSEPNTVDDARRTPPAPTAAHFLLLLVVARRPAMPHRGEVALVLLCPLLAHLLCLGHGWDRSRV